MPSSAWASLLRAPNPGPLTLDGTNTWVLRGEPGGPAVVVDPGPADDGHLDAIVATGPVGAIIVTHRHLDHVEGVGGLRRRLGNGTDPGHGGDPGHGAASAHGGDPTGGVPVFAADPGQAVGTAPLRDGDRLAIPGLDIEIIATPGHTSDSVCLLVSADGGSAVFTGDTILGRGTAVVAWPDGNLGDYLATLDRLTGYPGIPAFPGHGPVRPDCGEIAREYRAHREERLTQVRAALAAGATTPAEVVAHVYPDLEPALVPAALWTVRATLDHLGPPT
jgi:glyoxylase-like metal-dependent hydrolase (beta-lactamase superfamily II)